MKQLKYIHSVLHNNWFHLEYNAYIINMKKKNMIFLF
jgi:hypothetical protein